MRRMILLLNTVLLFGMFGPAAAQDSLPPAPYAYRQLDDPQQEAAAQDLMETLRCLKCQSQSIADSDAPMAGDMRHQVRIRIAAGESPEEVRGWLMQRYGDYVSYKPTVSTTTWPLFAIPLLLVLLAAGLVAAAWAWSSRGRRIWAPAAVGLLVLGGGPLGQPVLLWWNFVGRDQARLETAIADWNDWPNKRFGDVEAYQGKPLKAPSLDPSVRLK